MERNRHYRALVLSLGLEQVQEMGADDILSDVPISEARKRVALERTQNNGVPIFAHTEECNMESVTSNCGSVVDEHGYSFSAGQTFSAVAKIRCGALKLSVSLVGMATSNSTQGSSSSSICSLSIR